MHNKKNLFAVQIPLEHTQKRKLDQIESVMALAKPMGADALGSVYIAFDGYDDKPEEIFEIPEIRKFVRKAFKEYPDLFFFLTNLDELNNTILSCLCTISIYRREGEKVRATEDYGYGDDWKNRPKIPVQIAMPSDLMRSIVAGAVAYGASIGMPESTVIQHLDTLGGERFG